MVEESGLYVIMYPQGDIEGPFPLEEMQEHYRMSLIKKSAVISRDRCSWRGIEGYPEILIPTDGSASLWIMAPDGLIIGPVTVEYMREQISRGIVGPDDPISAGHDRWFPLSSVPSFAQILQKLHPDARKLARRPPPEMDEINRLNPRPKAPKAPPPPPPKAEPPQPSLQDRLQELRKTMEELKNKNKFEVLGVSPEAQAGEIRKAFLSLAKAYHPDSIPASEPEELKKLKSDIFTLISDANQTLSDDKTRQQYLEALKAGHSSEKMDVSKIFQAEDLFKRGDAYMNSRKYGEAIKCYEGAIKLYPEAEYHICLGWAVFMETKARVGNPNRKKAMAEIEKGMKMDPNLIRGHLVLGQIDKLDGKVEEALGHFEKVLQINPDNVEAQREIRLMDMRKGKGKKGLFR